PGRLSAASVRYASSLSCTGLGMLYRCVVGVNNGFGLGECGSTDPPWPSQGLAVVPGSPLEEHALLFLHGVEDQLRAGALDVGHRQEVLHEVVELLAVAEAREDHAVPVARHVVDGEDARELGDLLLRLRSLPCAIFTPTTTTRSKPSFCASITGT